MSHAIADTERLARVTLSRALEPGEHSTLADVARLGPVAYRDRVLADRVEGDTAEVLAERVEAVDPALELEQAARRGIRFVAPGDEEWPGSLEELGPLNDVALRGGVPVGLWLRGPMRLDELADSVAIVGTRDATTYGNTVAHDLASGLASAGRVVVSGAAFGIDYAAHRGAVAGGGDTVAVLACGIDRAYPAAHRAMIDHLAETTLVISESPPGHSPTRVRFLARNRLIAALTRGTVVVEAAARSGALSTARWADALSRHVMAVPGPVTSVVSQGPHNLVREGTGTLVTGAEDVLELVGEAGQFLLPELRGPRRPVDGLRRNERAVLEALPSGDPASVRSLSMRAGLGASDTHRALQGLAARGLALAESGGWRVSARARDKEAVSDSPL